MKSYPINYTRFEPENKKLEVLLDRDLSCWNHTQARIIFW